MKLRTLCLAAAALCAPPAAAFAATAAMHPELGAKLTGRHEVPQGSPVGHGIVNLNLKAASGKVCWTFQIVGLGKPSAAHIHRAPTSKAGPVVVPLGGAYKAKGCHRLEKDDRSDRVPPQRLLRQRPHRQIPERRHPRPTRRGHGAHVAGRGSPCHRGLPSFTSSGHPRANRPGHLVPEQWPLES